MFRIKNLIALSVLLLIICTLINVTAQESSKSRVYKFSTFVVSAPKPAYPINAAAAKAEGDVQVDVKINMTGKVIEVNFVSGDELFKYVVIAAAKNWMFSESTDKANIRDARLTFAFHLNDKDNNKKPSL